MNSGSKTSERPTATTPDNGRQKPSNPLSEEQYLEHRANEARVAMTRALRDIGQTLGKGANPVAWAKKRPLAVLGTAALAGFVTIKLIQREPKPAAVVTSDNHGNGETEKRPRPKRGAALSKRILREVMRLVQPALTGFVMSQIRPPAPQPEDQAGNTQTPVDEPIA